MLCGLKPRYAYPMWRSSTIGVSGSQPVRRVDSRSGMSAGVALAAKQAWATRVSVQLVCGA